MSWRIVIVSSNAKIDFKMDYLVIRNLDEVRRVHISEIAVLMLESTAISITAYSITYDEENFWNSFLKAMNFKVDFEDVSPAEALAERILMIQRFMKNPCIVLIGAKSWFADDELEQIYRTILANKTHLLLIEAVQKKAILPRENHRVIDKDLCELFPQGIME